VTRRIGALLGAVALLIGAVALLAGCAGSSSAGAYKARASAIATSTAAQADKAKVKAMLQPCIATGHIATAESCIRNLVPPSERAALGTCLSEAALSGLHSLETTGAQACLEKVTG
jgi:hypothetical protein